MDDRNAKGMARLTDHFDRQNVEAVVGANIEFARTVLQAEPCFDPDQDRGNGITHLLIQLRRFGEDELQRSVP